MEPPHGRFVTSTSRATAGSGRGKSMVDFLNFIGAAFDRVSGREERRLQERLLLREQTIREREEITRDREVGSR
jgi:hypothetical protein